MIHLKQMEKDGKYGFEVSGFRHEMFYLLKWLSHYEYGDKLKFNNKDLETSKSSLYSMVRATIWFTADLSGINKTEFAGMFKLTFASWEMVMPKMPDETNSKSEAMDLVNTLGDVAVAAIEGGEEWTKELYESTKRVAADALATEEDSKGYVVQSDENLYDKPAESMVDEITSRDATKYDLLGNIKDTLDGKTEIPEPTSYVATPVRRPSVPNSGTK